MTNGQKALTELHNDLVVQQASALKDSEAYKQKGNSYNQYYMAGEANALHWAIDLVKVQLDFLKDKEWLNEILEDIKV